MRSFRQTALDRRTFLRGSAAALALPWLDAMLPALRTCPPPTRRSVFVFSPNGMHMEAWCPDGEGRSARLARTLASLQPLQKRITVFSGLAIDGGRAHGDGPGDHARAGGSFLTCAHPRKTGGADIQAGVSIDQAIAAAVGPLTTFGSLQLGMERGASAGVCDSGYSCAYVSNISWRAADTPVAKETEPKAVFARLFGDPEQAGDAAAARAQRQLDRSVLDTVLADAKALSGRLGGADRQKLDQYLTSVRELEQRLQRLDEDVPKTPLPDGLLDRGQGYPEKLALMYELIALALATDRTRVVTFMLGNAGSNRSYKFLDVPEGHHDLSHHGQKPEKLAGIAKINQWQVEQFAKFLLRLQGQLEAGADLLAQSLVLLGSGIGDGNRHNHDDLPMLLAGEGGGAAKGQGHARLAKDTPAANLYLALLRAMGGRDQRFADSSGVLELG
ncbi:MAG TPA: DUF1552 domain-containing protein [Planctomycetota bacterium]|nr:DUF1552 domain-containing protein [Planctomycetota bacterium]